MLIDYEEASSKRLPADSTLLTRGFSLLLFRMITYIRELYRATMRITPAFEFRTSYVSHMVVQAGGFISLLMDGSMNIIDPKSYTPVSARGQQLLLVAIYW